MSLLTMHFWKFFVGLFLIIALGFLVLYANDFYAGYQARKETSEQQKIAKDLERQYMSDTFGGSTPEETLELFISALKAEDIDLAAKYFVLDERKAWRDNLEKIENAGNLGAMVSDLNKLGNKYPLIEGESSRFIFEALNDSGELILQADIGKGPNGVWKILDL